MGCIGLNCTCPECTGASRVADTLVDERPKRTAKTLDRARDAAYLTWRAAKETVMWLDDQEGGELLAIAQGVERQAWHAYDALVYATGKVTEQP